jgi:hypothetical protein
MPRKSKTKLDDNQAKESLLNEIYNDTFTIKNLSINIIRQMSKTINYDNQKEVIEILPILQKQMDIIDVANNKLMQIYQNINNSDNIEDDGE